MALPREMVTRSQPYLPRSIQKFSLRSNARAESSSAEPAEPQYEFMGPWMGPLGIMAGLPAVCYALVYTCNAGGCSVLKGPAHWPGFPPGTSLFTWEATAVFLGWFFAQVQFSSRICPPVMFFRDFFLPWPGPDALCNSLWSLKAVLAPSAQVLLHLALPGQREPGVKLPDGRRLRYKLTGDASAFLLAPHVVKNPNHANIAGVAFSHKNSLP